MATTCPTCQKDNPDDQKFCGDCGTQLGLSPDAPPFVTRTLDLPTQEFAKGSVFADRYKIEEQLGEGGMGQVYRAHDTQIQEDIAIKVLRPEIALDKRILERFRNELKFARKITHKSVCRMHDISVFNGTTYITMEYVEGEDLKSVIRRKGKLGIGQAMGVIMQIADGLVEAQSLGIVHRDLKPQNIMIDPDGNAKIMDFGIARSTKAEGVTQEGSIIGTPEYMSPEQVDGRTVDQRSDIYSLAVILYEMLTGHLPFSGETVLDIALKHKSQKPDNPQQLNKKIPDVLADLILRSMAKDPQERYQSAEELLKALMSIEEILPESERSAMRIVPRLGVKKAAQLSFKKMLLPTTAVAAIVIIALITWRLLFPPQQVDVPEGRPTLAVLYFKNNTGDSSFDLWKEKLPEMLTHDLMQSKYLSVVSQDQIYSFLNRKGLLEARNYSIDDLKELAEEVRANYFAQGFLTKSGENFTLSVSLQDAINLNPIGALDVSGRGTESFPSMVDDLSPKIKPYLGISTEDISTDFDENIADVTCPFPAAYDFYIKARRAKIEGRHEEAIELLDKAVALDPDFATAFRLQAEIYLSGDILYEGGWEKGTEAQRQASEAMQRRKVTERERLSIEGYDYHYAENRGKAREKFEELLAIYPDDYDANHFLGQVLDWHGENYDEAMKHWEAAIKSSLATIEDFGSLGGIYELNQQYEKAREIFRLGLENFPDNWNFKCMIAGSYCWEGQYERALAECENMYLADPLAAANCDMRGKTFYLMEEFQAAEDEFKKLLEREKVEDHTQGRRALINLYKLQGRFNDIFDQIELSKEDPNSHLGITLLIDNYISQGNFEAAKKALEEWKPSSYWGILFWKPYATGITMAKMKQWDEAMEVVDDFNDYMVKTNWTYSQLLNRLIADLQGRIELEREDYSLAIQYLEQAKELIPGFNHEDHAWHAEALARAYFESGNLERAREEYELITTLRAGRYKSGDIYAKSFYMLGKIAEEMGEKGEAKKQYTRFLELWKNADPGLPEVEDAKRRLAAL